MAEARDPFIFRNYRRGGPGWKLDWLGGSATWRCVEAAKIGIDKVTEVALILAEETHSWENQTGQTEASLFRNPAEYDNVKEEVWGAWGVDAIVRIPSHWNTYRQTPLSTKDTALFMEFGFHDPAGNFHAYPWLYPVWDETKVMLPAAVKAAYEGLGGTGDFPVEPPGINNIGTSSRAGWRRFMDGF